jgi:hypothetical protein
MTLASSGTIAASCSSSALTFLPMVLATSLYNPAMTKHLSLPCTLACVVANSSSRQRILLLSCIPWHLIAPAHVVSRSAFIHILVNASPATGPLTNVAICVSTSTLHGLLTVMLSSLSYLTRAEIQPSYVSRCASCAGTWTLSIVMTSTSPMPITSLGLALTCATTHYFAITLNAYGPLNMHTHLLLHCQWSRRICHITKAHAFPRTYLQPQLLRFLRSQLLLALSIWKIGRSQLVSSLSQRTPITLSNCFTTLTYPLQLAYLPILIGLFTDSTADTSCIPSSTAAFSSALFLRPILLPLATLYLRNSLLALLSSPGHWLSSTTFLDQASPPNLPDVSFTCTATKAANPPKNSGIVRLTLPSNSASCHLCPFLQHSLILITTNTQFPLASLSG